MQTSIESRVHGLRRLRTWTSLEAEVWGVYRPLLLGCQVQGLGERLRQGPAADVCVLWHLADEP